MKLDILKDMAASFFESHPYASEMLCIFYRSTNVTSINFPYTVIAPLIAAVNNQRTFFCPIDAAYIQKTLSWHKFQVPKASEKANLQLIWLRRFILCAQSASIQKIFLYELLLRPLFKCSLWLRTVINGAVTLSVQISVLK